MNIITWILIGIGIAIVLFILFAFSVGALLTLGFRNRDEAYYDPEDKQWHPLVSLTEE